jgi:predicted extracellular nuclease
MKRKHVFLLVVMVAVLVSLVTKGAPLRAQTAVFINEIHYDNAGTDEGEAIEIAGPAGTDLTGWSLVLYNGSGGVVYNTTPLNGTIPDQQNGYGTIFVSYPTNGIQNGAPDGVALVDADNNVVQFLSYEGSFMAVDGPAGGLTSTDIGVAEESSSPVGYSLQLVGSGTMYEDFTWDAAQPSTFGAVNTGQSFGSGTPPLLDVKISEIRIDQPGADNDEYFELAGAPGASLDGLTYLVIGDGVGGSGVIENVTDLSGHIIGGSGFFVAAESSFALGTADLTTTLNFENDDNLTHLLVAGFTGSNGDDLDLDDNGVLDVTPWSELLDLIALIKEENPPLGTEYHYGPPTVGPDGSFVPGHAFNCDGVWLIGAFNPDGGDDTPGAVNNCPAPDVKISEIRIDQPGADNDEYFELAGAPGASLDGLTYLVIGDGVGGSGVIENVTDLSGHTIGGSGFFVAAESSFALGTADLTTTLNFENDDNLTHLLVAGFTGSNGDDLDLDDNGVLDVTPWSELLDLIALIKEENPPLGTEYHYGPPTVGPDDSFVPGHVFLCGNGWQIGSFSLGEDTPGAENACEVPIIEAKIHEVQGSGSSVAITDPVLVEAIVVGDFQADDQLRGFFIQEEDSDADADPNTSEGIFVFCPGCATDVAVGDLVQVAGQPVDFFGMSQIDTTVAVGQVTVMGSNKPLPAPVVVDLPASGSTRAETTFEHVEGMLVTFADTLVVSEYFELARYGQLVLTADARPRQFTDANEPGVAEYAAFLDDLNSKRIILDDDNNIQNDAILVGADEPYFWPRPGLSNSNLIRGGDSISGLTGVLHWSFAGQSGTDAWRVRPVEEAFTYAFTSVNERPFQPENVGGSFKVASFNVLNYFTTLDSRGADSLAELDRQRAKIAAAICGMDADVVGLIEIENNGSVALLDLLNGFNGINANCGPYGIIDTGVIGTDEIAVAFIYKTATVNPVGGFAVLDSSVDSRFLDDKNRPALAQTFAEAATGAKLTVVVNHLKSKGSACDDVGDPDVLDGQGNCNLTRKWAAEAMVHWLDMDPTGSGDGDFLIIGDLNAYRNEDPIGALEAGGYVDLLDTLIGPTAYTYLFDGQLGYLDHALANNDLFGQVTGVTVWHLNADEIPVFDYNDDIRDPGEQSFERESGVLPIYEPNAFRSSDHDPVIVGLDLNAPPNCSGAFASPDTLWPVNHQMVAIEILGVTDPDGDPITITIDSIFQDEPVNGLGDGDTAPDGAGIGTSTAWVRAERDGRGNGRVYHIFFTATDSYGNSCSGKVLVSVPKNLGRNGAAVDDGPLYNSTLVP